MFYYTETNFKIYNLNVLSCGRPQNNFRYRKCKLGMEKNPIFNTLPVVRSCRPGDNLLFPATLHMFGLFAGLSPSSVNFFVKYPNLPYYCYSVRCNNYRLMHALFHIRTVMRPISARGLSPEGRYRSSPDMEKGIH